MVQLKRVTTTCFFSNHRTKAVSQDIYNKYRLRVWGLPFPGSVALHRVFSGRNQLHQWPRECMLRWFNQSWKAQYRKGLQFVWRDTTYPIWEPLRNFMISATLAHLHTVWNWLVAALQTWFSRALKHTELYFLQLDFSMCSGLRICHSAHRNHSTVQQVICFGQWAPL